MRTFSYSALRERRWYPEMESLAGSVSAAARRTEPLLQEKGDDLQALARAARLKNITASNAIEGITAPDSRISLLCDGKDDPQSTAEQQIAGYADAHDVILESFDAIPLTPNYILQLHKILYGRTGATWAGKTKSVQNYISATYPDGHTETLFTPPSPFETPEALSNLCDEFRRAAGAGETDFLIAMPVFIHDFLCIHPFNDGNGRMSRLLTLLLLYRADYNVGKYISLEKLISGSKETYYETLQASSEGWHEGENDYAPFVAYLLGIIAAAYREFDSRTELLSQKGVSKPDRISALIKDHLGTITKTEIMEQLPDISQATVQRTLAELLKAEKIIKLGGGRYTKYTWNREND